MGRTAQRVAMVLAGVVVVLGVGSGIAWRLDGGSWENIATPSMGTAAPVGSLVFTKPATVDQLRVGDVITYQPPTPLANHTTTHRVVSKTGTGPDAFVRTRGDVNGADDPFDIHSSDIRGKIEAIFWGGGWLLRGLPMLALGMAAVWIATRYWASARWTIPLRVLGFSAVVSTVVVILKPFVGAVSLGNNADAAGTHITLVSIGMLPSRFSGAGGGHVDLADGEVGVLTTQVAPGAKGAGVTGGTHMPWWLWIVMILIWLTPMIVGLLAEQRRQAALDAEGPDDTDDTDDTDGPGDPDNPPPDDETPTGAMVPLVRLTPRRRRHRTLAAAGAMGMALLALVTTTTSAAFTAKVANTTDTAASNPYFTCLAVETAAGTANTTFVWPFDDSPVSSGSAARDVSGNSRAGVYTGGFGRTTNRPCPRDTGTTAVTLSPTNNTPSYVTPNGNVTAAAGPSTFLLSLWFRTTTTTGGRMIGFGDAQTGVSGDRDRHVYMTNAGKLVFGVYPSGTVKTVQSPLAYNDGTWHQVVASLSSAGMVLYVDGAQVAADTSTTTAQSFSGFWRVGYDSLTGWPSDPSTDYWTGSLAWAQVLSGRTLTAAQVAQLDAPGT